MNVGENEERTKVARRGRERRFYFLVVNFRMRQLNFIVARHRRVKMSGHPDQPYMYKYIYKLTYSEYDALVRRACIWKAYKVSANIERVISQA